MKLPHVPLNWSIRQPKMHIVKIYSGERFFMVLKVKIGQKS